jgi:hypothetical protein
MDKKLKAEAKRNRRATRKQNDAAGESENPVDMEMDESETEQTTDELT